MGLFNNLFTRNRAMNDSNLRALREPKSKYYRLIQVLAIICLVFGVILFALGFVFDNYFGIFLHIALVLVALGCGGFIVLPWVNVLERDKRLKEEGYPVVAWRKYLGFGFVAAIAVCVALWIIAVFIVHVDTFAALFERAFGEKTEEVIAQENVLKFLCFAILLTIQVCVASAITVGVVRFQKKFLTMRIISYVTMFYLDIWASWIIGLLFNGSLVTPLDDNMIRLATPLDVPMLVIAILSAIALLIIFVALDKMVYRERMDLFTRGIGAAYTATDDDILQGTYDATVSLDEAEMAKGQPVGGRKRRVSAPSAKPAEERSVEEQLERIKDLRDKGVLTEEEYQAKRKEIIDNM